MLRIIFQDSSDEYKFRKYNWSSSTVTFEEIDSANRLGLKTIAILSDTRFVAV